MRSVLYAVAVALFALVNAPADAAQLNAEKVKAAKQAADEFLVLAKDSEINGRVPREADPKVKRLLEIVFDRAALGSGLLPIEESAKISELINNANRVGFVYLLAGTGTTDLGKISTDEKVALQADRNMTVFAPEMGRWFDYQLIVQGSMADSTLAFLAKAKKDVLERPQVKNGIAGVRAGLGRAIGGLFQSMTSDGVDDAWRRDRLLVLAEIAPKAAKLMTAESARELQEQAVELAAAVKDPAVQSGLKTFAQTIAASAKP